MWAGAQHHRDLLAAVAGRGQTGRQRPGREQGPRTDLALTSPPLLGDRDALRERDAPRETDALRKHAYLVYSEGLVTTNRPREERGVISILRAGRASPY